MRRRMEAMRSFDSRHRQGSRTPRTMEILLLNGHPEPDGLCADLTDAYVTAARAHASVRRIDLYKLRFDPVLRRDAARQPLEPDLADAAEALLTARHVTWIFPCWWSATPALVKGFVDRVFTAGFAFRYRGRHQQPERLLAGRSARVICSMDSPGFWYRWVQGRPLHKSFVQGTLGFVGFAPIATRFVYEARFLDASRRARTLASVAADAAADVRALRRPERSGTRPLRLAG